LKISTVYSDAVNRRTKDTMDKGEEGKRQILIYKIPHIKLKIVHDEPHNKEKPGSKLRCSGMVYSSSLISSYCYMTRTFLVDSDGQIIQWLIEKGKRQSTSQKTNVSATRNPLISRYTPD
jgi:hypothetical protein